MLKEAYAKNLYGEESWEKYQKNRYAKLIDRFEQRFGNTEFELFSSPGRTELLGNHTDHERGEVLAASVDIDLIAAAASSDDGSLILISEDEEFRLDTSDTERKEEERGTTKALLRGCLHGFKERGYRIGGFTAVVTSDVAVGSGLSSSAAFEVLILTILSFFYNENKVTPEVISQVGQYAETVYFGKPCGLMDQTACAYGNAVYIDFANPSAIRVKQVDFRPADYGYSLCITNTHGSHADLTGEYASVTEEMKAVATVFEKEDLCGVTLEELYAHTAVIRTKCGDRALLRAIHCAEENERVRRGVKALQDGQMEAFLQIVEESGNSSFKYLQNVYVSSRPRVQELSLALAYSEGFLKGGKGVCRVHGGGFAGTIQAFVRREYTEAYKSYMDGLFGAGSCMELKIRDVGGIHLIK